MLHCPDCGIDNLHFIKKRTDKIILNEEWAIVLRNTEIFLKIEFRIKK